MYYVLDIRSIAATVRRRCHLLQLDQRWRVKVAGHWLEDSPQHDTEFAKVIAADMSSMNESDAVTMADPNTMEATIGFSKRFSEHDQEEQSRIIWHELAHLFTAEVTPDMPMIKRAVGTALGLIGLGGNFPYDYREEQAEEQLCDLLADVFTLGFGSEHVALALAGDD